MQGIVSTIVPNKGVAMGTRKEFTSGRCIVCHTARVTAGLILTKVSTLSCHLHLYSYKYSSVSL